MKWPIIITALTFSLSVKADLFGFCFSSKTQIESVRNYLGKFLLDNEQIFLRRSFNCIEVQAPSHRKKLVDKVLSMKFAISKRYRPSLMEASDPTQQKNPKADRCKIEVTRIGEDKSRTRSLRLGRKNDLREQKGKVLTAKKSQLLLSSGRPGRLRVDDQDIQVTCIRRGTQNFELEFSLSSARNSVATSITISRGQPVDLGNVVEDLKKKKRDLSLRDGLDYSKTKGTSKAHYQLMVR